MSRLRWKSSAIIPSAHMAAATGAFLLLAAAVLAYALLAPDHDLIPLAVIVGGWGLAYGIATGIALSIERDDP